MISHNFALSPIFTISCNMPVITSVSVEAGVVYYTSVNEILVLLCNK